jgi:hypothetical protein
MEMNDEQLDHYLKKKISELDTQFPSALGTPEDIWTQIENGLEKKKPSRIWYWASIAASVLLVASGFTVWLLSRNDHTEVVFRTEMQDSTAVQEKELLQSFVRENNEESEALHYILDQCAVEQQICSSENFKEMKKQLEEVTKDIGDLDKQLDLYGPDPNLVKARVSLENHKTYIMNELIQQIKS